MTWPFVGPLAAVPVVGAGDDDLSFYQRDWFKFVVVVAIMMIIWTTWDLVVKTDNPLIWAWNNLFGWIPGAKWEGYRNPDYVKHAVPGEAFTAVPAIHAGNFEYNVGKVRNVAQAVDAQAAAMQAAVSEFNEKRAESQRGPEQFTEMPSKTPRAHLPNLTKTRDIAQVIKHEPLPTFAVNADSGPQTAFRYFNPVAPPNGEFEDEWIAKDRRVIDDKAHEEGRALFSDNLVL